MTQVPVSLQLYSIRDLTKADFAGAAAQVAAIGYSAVELAGYGNLGPKAAKEALDKAGLKVSGMHVGIKLLREQFDKVVEEAKAVGSRDVICPWWQPEEFTSRQAMETIGAELNAVGARLRAAGLRFSFHNHGGEFKRIEGRPAMEWLLAAAEPRNLLAEVDVYWVKFAGYSPGKFIREQGARARILHLKDEKELGLGPVDFGEVFAAAESVGAVEWYVVEQEDYNHVPIKSVALCFEQLKKWGKA
jgi:sugar phosphate isomerase/epimerase